MSRVVYRSSASAYLAASADETARRLLPTGTEDLMRADEYLIVHLNTVHHRLRRVQNLSGQRPPPL